MVMASLKQASNHANQMWWFGVRRKHICFHVLVTPQISNLPALSRFDVVFIHFHDFKLGNCTSYWFPELTVQGKCAFNLEL